jgi:hypothetical protein
VLAALSEGSYVVKCGDDRLLLLQFLVARRHARIILVGANSGNSEVVLQLSTRQRPGLPSFMKLKTTTCTVCSLTSQGQQDESKLQLLMSESIRELIFNYTCLSHSRFLFVTSSECRHYGPRYISQQ